MKTFCTLTTLALVQLLANGSKGSQSFANDAELEFSKGHEKQSQLTELFKGYDEDGYVDQLLAVTLFPNEEALYKAIVDEIRDDVQGWEERAKVLVELKTDKPDVRCFEVLAGRGPFEKLELKVRRFIACWLFQCRSDGNLKLTRLLTKFHQSFHLFKESVTKIGGEFVAAAIISIILDIECSLDGVERIDLFKNLQSLFSKWSIVKTACELNGLISSKSSFADIEKICYRKSLLKWSTNLAVDDSVELRTARMFECQLKEVEYTDRPCKIDLSLLFDERFVQQHGIDMDGRLRLVRRFGIYSVLSDVVARPNLNGLSVDALLLTPKFRPLMESSDWKVSVFRYSIEEWAEFEDAFFHTPSQAKVTQIVLGYGFASNLTSSTKVRLLHAMNRIPLAQMVLRYRDNRRQLLLAYFYSDFVQYKASFVRELSEADFSCLLQATLSTNDHDHLMQFCVGRLYLIAKCIIDYVADDEERLNRLNITETATLSLIFLLTKHEGIVRFLRKGLTGCNVLQYFSILNAQFSRETMAKAVKRAELLK